MKTYHREGLRLGRIGYFSVEHNGVALEKSNAYAIIYNDGEEYHNIFNDSDFPIFERSPFYANYTKDGEPYGSKVVHVGGTEASGPCYVIEDEPYFERIAPAVVDIDTLKNIMYASCYFFPDRVALLETEDNCRWVRKLKKEDKKRLAHLEEFFKSQEVAIQYIKRL